MTKGRGWLLAFAAVACVQAPPAPARPVRLSVRANDTIIVNNRQPTRLKVRALDAAGRTVARASLHFIREGGDSLAVNDTGVVTCSERGDMTVRASVGSVGARFLVRCRPVEFLRMNGPLQFVLGDSLLGRPQELPIEAYGPDGHRVVLISGYADTGDTAVAALHGLTLYPRRRGISGTFVRVGDRTARTGVHVYERMATLAGLDTALRIEPERRELAVPIDLARGEYLRQRLPQGSWMLAMLPEDEREANGISLHVDGAECTPNILNTPRRFGCHSGPNATLTVYRPIRAKGPEVARADLLVRWLFM
jgi:hypothetical protein